ncbi:MAG: hypothetical protein ACOCSL_05230 [Thermoplasmatota archaeon]
MVDEEQIGIVDRFKGFFKERPITPSERVDRFVTRKLPDYIDEYKLATRADLEGVDKKIEEFVSDINELKEWKLEAKKRHRTIKNKIERLERKHDMED